MSDGLPLLVEEVVDALERGAADPGVPPTVAELTRWRMNALPGPAREILHTAAVLGDLDWQLLPAASGCSEDEVAVALRAAVDASLLVVDPSTKIGLRWRHALTREAVLDQLLAPERAMIARRAVTALEAGVPAGDRWLLIADLNALCGRGAHAAQALLIAASEAADAGALGSAEAFLRRAADLAPDDHDVLLELVRVLALAGRTEDATAIGSRLANVIDGERLTMLCVHLARAAVAAGRWVDAARFLEPVATSADRRVDAVRAHVALGEQDPVRAVDFARRAAADSRRAGHPEAVCEALEVLGRVLRIEDPAGSEAAFDEAERCAAEHGLTVWRIRALSELSANDMLRTGRMDRLQETRRLAMNAGMLATVAVLDVQLCACATFGMDPSPRGLTPNARSWRLTNSA